MNKYNKIVFVNGSAPPLNADNLNHMDEGIERATNGAIALETEITTARGGHNSLGARLDTVDTNLTKKANKSEVDSINSRLQSAETTLKNKANTTDVSNSLAKKADKSTTLAGYGITDAYTKEKTDQKLAQKLNSMPFDSEPKNNSPCYLTSGTVYNSLLTKADKTETDNSLGEKADKADVDDVKAYIGYTDSDILGLQVDFENKTFTRLAGAVGLSANSDFDKFTMYGGRRRCNVLDDGTITAYYGDEGYTEDGSNGQVMVYQPAFYYKVVPLKLEKTPIQVSAIICEKRTTM